MLGFILLAAFPLVGQEKENYVAMNPVNWEYKPNSVDFVTYKGRQSMQIKTSSDQVVLKDLDFTSGTIEYDIEPMDPYFTSMYFRWSTPEANECFYFRTERAGNSSALDAIQYAPFVKGINLWDMLYHYQSNADFKKSEWNHVKLVISGKQMLVYVNDMQKPALEIPYLEGDTENGTLAFDGRAIISNLTVKHNETGMLSPTPGIDLTNNDPRYLRKWQVSEPMQMDPKVDFQNKYYTDSLSRWKPILAERRGLVNITRQYGKSDHRRIVWLKTAIHSTKNQKVKMKLGFSDDVWVYLNDRVLYTDKNSYGSPIMKQPDGRCTIENSSFSVPLAEGNNQLLIGVANDFYGWGIIARLEALNGIKIER